MPKFSLFLLVSFSLIPFYTTTGKFFSSMDTTALKDMIMGRIDDPCFKPAPVHLGLKGGLDWGIFAHVKSFLGEGIHPSIQMLQELDVPKQTTLEAVQTAAAYATAGGAIAVGVGNVVSGTSDAANGVANVPKVINDVEEQRQRAIKLEEAASVAAGQSIPGRPRTLSSERREAVTQLNDMSLDESRYMARQEELSNSPTRYFRELHFKRLNSLIKTNIQEAPKQ